MCIGLNTYPSERDADLDLGELLDPKHGPHPSGYRLHVQTHPVAGLRRQNGTCRRAHKTMSWIFRSTRVVASAVTTCMRGKRGPGSVSSHEKLPRMSILFLPGLPTIQWMLHPFLFWLIGKCDGYESWRPGVDNPGSLRGTAVQVNAAALPATSVG